MSILEVYETAESLKTLSRGVAYPNNSMRCIVSKIIPTRPREFGAGGVFTVVGTLRAGASADAPENLVHVNFYDEWATGASFTDPGDIIIVKGFMLVNSPVLPTDAQPKQAPEYFVVPLALKGSLRVLQPGEQGDTMEATITPDSFDMPRIRVLPRLDHTNRCFINDVKKHSK